MIPFIFQPTLPARGATASTSRRSAPPGISTHAPREGSDLRQSRHAGQQRQFQPTLPARGATARVCAGVVRQGHFNPRSPRGERRKVYDPRNESDSISTRAPREGSDLLFSFPRRHLGNFNPRSPRGERPAPQHRYLFLTKFQPALPARGATLRAVRDPAYGHISTRAPREGSDDSPFFPCGIWGISTRAPREGSD